MKECPNTVLIGRNERAFFPITDTQKIKRKEYKHNNKCNKNSKEGNQEKKGTDKNYKKNHKTMNKIAISACSYQSIITLNVSGLN